MRWDNAQKRQLMGDGRDYDTTEASLAAESQVQVSTSKLRELAFLMFGM